MKAHDEILEELRTISTELFNYKKNEQPLSVPDNYFNAFTEEMILKLSSENSLLSSIKKETITVPPQYFDNLADTVLDKIKQAETKEEPVAPRFSIVKILRQTAIAAAIVGVIFTVNKTSTTIPNTIEEKISSLSTDEIYDYMNTNSHEFSMEQIDKAVQPIISSETASLEISEDISDSSIQKYLNENNSILETEDIYTDIF